ncbi:MAG: methionyl-tRNA formyltransferase [Wenzhouxiangellaceae bacterium]|nr:methionyl-tRNA formyltransferase [Wenzhouxiangellaceae bacterium]
MSKPRIIFAGTPEFACPSLRMLIERQAPVAVLTQPDRPAGRGRKLSPSPVKQLAQDTGITVMQPQSLKNPEARRQLESLAPDLLITAAYGLLLPQAVLDLPTHGCWNLHASLLPRWRGASPIQQAILAGDAETGISLMQMDAGLDTGDVLLTCATAIDDDENAGQLGERLAQMAARLLAKALEQLELDCLPEPIAQDDARASHAPLIRKTDAQLDWNQDAELLARQVRAYNPWPVAFGLIADQTVRVFQARPVPLDSAPAGTVPGDLLTDAGHRVGIQVACGRGALEILELQAAGRRRMSAREWLNAKPQWRG